MEKLHVLLTEAVDQTLKCHQISEKQSSKIKNALFLLKEESANLSDFQASIVKYFMDILGSGEIKPLSARKINTELLKQIEVTDENKAFLVLMIQITQTKF